MGSCFKKINWSSVYLVIYLFLLIFLPPIIKDINLLLPLFVYSLFIIVLKYRKRLVDVIRKRKDTKFLKFLFLYITIYAVTIVLNGLFSGHFYLYNYFISFYSIMLVIICISICIIYMFLFCDKHNISFDDLIKYIIIASLIQSGITLMCLLSCSIKNFFITIMRENTGEILLSNPYHLERRFFGFSNNMFDSYGFGTGLISLLPLYYSIRNSKKWLIAVPFLLLIPFLNSRTGLVVFLIGFICFVIFIIKEKKYKEYILSLVCAIALAVFGILFVWLFNKATIEWIITDIKSFFDGSIYGTATSLFSDTGWKIPNGIFILFGKGITVAGYGGLKGVLGFSSDVGYVNELWRTGLLGFSIIILVFFNYIKSIYRNIRSDYKYFVLSLIPILIISHIKFHILCCNPGITIIIAISVYVLLDKYESYKGSNDLITIVVPIYNVEKYLEKCIKSLLCQTYKNIEILLINDGSPDDSSIICKKYLKKDKRIKYIVQDNKGLSGARNTGIKHSSGKYIVFVDSDDYVNKYFIEKLYKAIKVSKSSMAFCRYKYVYNQNQDSNIYEYGNIEKYPLDSKYDILYNHLKDYAVVAWNKIYDKNIFSTIEYPEGKIHEDQYVICDIIDKCHSIAYTNEELYYYLQRNNSITGEYKINRLDILDSLKRKMNFFEKKKMKKYKEKALYDYYYQLIIQKSNLSKHFPKEKKKVNNINKEIDKYSPYILKSLYINPLKKIKLLLKMINH